MTQVRVNDIWLPTVGGVGSLKWSTIADGGSEQASWRMPLPDSFVHPDLHIGAEVQIREGTLPVWSGVLSEPNISEDGWEFTATGLFEKAGQNGFLCFDAFGNTSSIPDVAIDRAIADGIGWTRPASLSSVAFSESDETDYLNSLSDLLDAWATSEGKRWSVNAAGEVYAYADPTIPTWHMAPGSTRLGLAGDDYASDIYLRYRDSASTYATEHVSDPVASADFHSEHPVDLTTLGVITGAQATAIGTGMLAKGKARFAVTDAMTPNRYQLTTPGGQPAYLPFVRAGQMVRSFGVVNQQGVTLPYFDWVIGKTEYEAGSREIQLTPTELAARALGDILSVAVA